MSNNLVSPPSGDPFKLPEGPVLDSPEGVDSVLSGCDLSEIEPHWSEKFQYDLYDWDDPEFLAQNKGKSSWLPVLLTRGYFMMVARVDYRLATLYPDGAPKRWHAHILRDPDGNIVKVYACRRGRSDEMKSVYVHRELKGCILGTGVVDHKNGWGLDNRSTVNLCRTGYSANGSNSVRRRTKNFDLPVGVERIEKGSKKGRYRGIRAKRLGKRRVKVIRSKLTWASPDLAARWYQNQLRTLHKGRKSWAHNPDSVNWPVFPPLLEDEISQRSLKLRNKIQTSDAGDIPF